MTFHLDNHWRLFLGLNPFYWKLGRQEVRHRVGKPGGLLLKAFCLGPVEVQHWTIWYE